MGRDRVLDTKHDFTAAFLPLSDWHLGPFWAASQLMAPPPWGTCWKVSSGHSCPAQDWTRSGELLRGPTPGWGWKSWLQEKAEGWLKGVLGEHESYHRNTDVAQSQRATVPGAHLKAG